MKPCSCSSSYSHCEQTPFRLSKMKALFSFYSDALRIAVQSIFAHKLRAFLTLIGIIIGVASVVTVGASISGLNTYVVEKVAKVLGSNHFMMARMAFSSRVSDEGFEQLQGLDQLETLEFGGNKMSGVALPLLKLLPSLRELNVSGLQRTDSGEWGVAINDFNMDNIAQLEQLEALNLGETSVSDRGLAKLAKLTKLQHRFAMASGLMATG